MAFVWTGFRIPRTFKKISVTKFALLLWVRRKFQSMFIPFWGTGLLLGLKTNELIVWMPWVKWNKANFKCTIETQLRSFYFKLFHKAICTNQFLHRIGRTDSPNCYFCYDLPETILHLFCECEQFPLFWMNDVFWLIMFLGNPSLSQILNRMFGVTDLSEHDNCINFLFNAKNFILTDANFSKPTPIFCIFNLG